MRFIYQNRAILSDAAKNETLLFIEPTYILK